MFAAGSRYRVGGDCISSGGSDGNGGHWAGTICGDDAHADVVGARKAGLHAAWINRHDADWPQEQHGDPDHHEFADMKELAEWVLRST